MSELHQYRIEKVAADVSAGDQETIRIIDPDAAQFTIGTDFYEWAIKESGYSPKLARSHLAQVCTFLTFLWPTHGASGYLQPFTDIQAAATDFLRSRGLRVTPTHGGSMRVEHRNDGMSTSQGRRFTSANRLFYEFLTLKEKYPNPNPFLCETTDILARYSPFQPFASRLCSPEKYVQGLKNFFYFIDPKPNRFSPIIDDPDLKEKILNQFKNPLFRTIISILFESGANIHEVLSLNVGDWRAVEGKAIGAKAISKGSGELRVKTIFWSLQTNHMLIHYFHSDRRLSDKLGRDLDELPDEEPVFINKHGRRMTYSNFHHTWETTLKQAGLKITTHQVRSWFIVSTLKAIDNFSNGDKMLARQYRQHLMQLLHLQRLDCFDSCGTDLSELYRSLKEKNI